MMVCPCCVPQDPCSVIVDGVRLSIASFNPYEVLEANFGGIAVPGNVTTTIDGVVDSVAFGTSSAGTVDITREGCDRQQEVETELAFIGPSYASSIGDCCTYSDINRYSRTFDFEVVNATTCRLHGGISWFFSFQPCWNSSDSPPAASLYIESTALWEWECFVVDGVPGEVTVSRLCGIRYQGIGSGNATFDCGDYGPTPTVTLTFAPP